MIYLNLEKSFIIDIQRKNKFIIEKYWLNKKEINSIEMSGNSNCPKNCPIKKLDNDWVKTYKMFGNNYNCINTIRYEEVFKNAIKLLKEEEN